MYDSKLIERINKKVKKSGDCLIWQGAKTKKHRGYGLIKVSTHQTRLVHRILWEHKNGEAVPGNLLVLHTCDNSLCVNPDHFFLGTQKDNMDDMRTKGRANPKWYMEKAPLPGKARGERSGSAKFTSKIIMSIFNDKRPRKEIAKDFSISTQQISNIKRRATWKHILCAACHEETHE